MMADNGKTSGVGVVELSRLATPRLPLVAVVVIPRAERATKSK